MKKQKKEPNAVFKKGSKTAKTDIHHKHRCSVFGTTKPRNPLTNVMFDEQVKSVRLTSANKRNK